MFQGVCDCMFLYVWYCCYVHFTVSVVSYMLLYTCLCVCLDYIAAPCSQEDDIHNVQSVIDSLSLDYLQISLSHITGIINIFTLNNNIDEIMFMYKKRATMIHCCIHAELSLDWLFGSRPNFLIS